MFIFVEERKMSEESDPCLENNFTDDKESSRLVSRNSRLERDLSKITQVFFEFEPSKTRPKIKDLT